MNRYQLKDSKINAVVQLQVKYNRLSKGLSNPDVDRKAIEHALNRISEQISQLESEIATLG